MLSPTQSEISLSRRLLPTQDDTGSNLTPGPHWGHVSLCGEHHRRIRIYLYVPSSQPEIALQAALSCPHHLPVPKVPWLHSLQGQGKTPGARKSPPSQDPPTQRDDQLVAELRTQDPR